MTGRSDDLTDLFTAKPTDLAIPMRYLSGTIQSWNPVTLENTVKVGATVLTDLNVLGVAEATTYGTGTVVGIALVDSTWAIIGRFVIPNTQEAFDAITQLSSRTGVDIVNVQEATTSNTFTDLTTPGPEVTVTIGASGRALLLLSAKAGWSVVAADVASGARMSAELSGPNNTAAAAVTWAAWNFNQYGSTNFSVSDSTITSAYVFEGLNPGSTTFTAKYRSDTVGVSVDFNRRTIVVIAL